MLGDLQLVFLVMSANQSAADALRWHNAVWEWVMKLSPNGDQHELAMVFIVLAGDAARTTEALLTGLGLAGTDQAAAGHAIIPMDAPLADILAEVVRIQPMDLPPLRARQAADSRHASLRGLRCALEAGDSMESRAAAIRVIQAFGGHEYLLDLFCRPPSHRNGNLLRGWLNELVTSGVTPQNAHTVDDGPLAWLSIHQSAKGT